MRISQDSHGKQPAPEKLRATRVRRHLLRTRERLQRALDRGGIHRPAVDALDSLPVDLATLDLLTAGIDMTSDPVLRCLTAQARSSVLAALCENPSGFLKNPLDARR